LYHRNEPTFLEGNELKVFLKWCKYMNEYINHFLLKPKSAKKDSYLDSLKKEAYLAALKDIL
jgi:hypothetical protein